MASMSSDTRAQKRRIYCETLPFEEVTRPRTVLLAYEDFLRLSRRDRRAELTADLSEAEISAVERSAMAPGHEALDADMAPDAAV